MKGNLTVIVNVGLHGAFFVLDEVPAEAFGQGTGKHEEAMR